jgi:hypothetical protein
MSNVRYAIAQHPTTEEYHLFKGELTSSYPAEKCNYGPLSECKKVNFSECSIVVGCLTEQKAREKCAEAEYGRKVCGTCVSTLYADS